MQWCLLSRRFWHAHNTSIRQALRQHREEICATVVPRQEYAFWRAWIRIVLASELLSPPTIDCYVGRFLEDSMPPYAPLDATTPTTEKSNFRRNFLKFVTLLGTVR